MDKVGVSTGSQAFTATCVCPCLQAVRKGNYPVVATNHTLILNWNSQTVPLLRQIAINKKEQGGPAYAGYCSIHLVLVVCLRAMILTIR